MANDFQLFQVSQKGLIVRDDKALILELAERPGMWDLPGGRIDEGEMAESAFKREIQEELNVAEVIAQEVIDYESIYSGEGNATITVLGIIRHIEVSGDIALSFEHSNSQWITSADIDTHEFVWPNMKRALRKVLDT